MNILEEIAEKRKVDIERRKQSVSLEVIRQQATMLAEEFPYLEIAGEYEAAGASAISVLTEPEYFLGKDEYLKEIAEVVQIPVLRKDFIVDAYQIYEAKVLGASAVLIGETLMRSPDKAEMLRELAGK